MSNFKAQVTNLLEGNRTFTAARNLYNKMPGKSLAFLANMNRMPNNPANFKKVAYECCRLVGISEHQMMAMLSKPLTEKTPTEENGTDNVDGTSTTPTEQTLEERVLALDETTASYATVLKPIASEISLVTNTPPLNQTKVVLIEYIAAYKALLKKK